MGCGGCEESGIKSPGAGRLDAGELPGLLEMAVNFGGAMLRWRAAGFAVVDRATFDERLAICRGCEHWRNWRCAKCGCTKLKLWLPDQTCALPEGEKKW